MTDGVEIGLVVLLVLLLGYGLVRLFPDPPNPVRAGSNFFATNLLANTWWGGAGAILLAPVLGYFEGLAAGLVILVTGTASIAVTSAMLRAD
jgi:hypothetical protein